MPITTQCPFPDCGQSLTVTDDQLGQPLDCPSCRRKFTPEAPTVQATLPALVKIDRFAIRGQIGAGAFGTVYRAFDQRLNREVAVKVLRPERLTNPETLRRFLREARATAQLHHSNIVAVHDAGQDGPHHYLATTLVRGCALHLMVPTGGLDFRRAVNLTIQLADALAYSHAQGIVHRDVKPANILIGEQDRLYLTDFGLAASLDPESSRMTFDGAVLGTPAFMAPEQAAGDLKQVGPAADQYGAGVVFYNLLTGELPFNGTVGAVLHQVQSQAPTPPSQHRPDLDPALEAICLRAMAKRPDERFPSCGDLAAALRAWLGVGDKETGHYQPSSGRRQFGKGPALANGVSLILALVAVLLAGYTAWLPGTSGGKTVASVALGTEPQIPGPVGDDPPPLGVPNGLHDVGGPFARFEKVYLDETINVHSNRNTPIKEVIVSRPGIVEASEANPKALNVIRVKGKKLGTTRLTLIDQDGYTTECAITVIPTLEHLRQSMIEAYPISKNLVLRESSGGVIWVQGVLETEGERTNIHRFLSAMAGLPSTSIVMDIRIRNPQEKRPTPTSTDPS